MTVRLLLLGAIVVSLALTPLVAQRPQPDLAGIYTAEGQDGEGKTYRAVVEIVSYGEVVTLTWTFEHSGSAVGYGLVQKGVLAVIYQGTSGVGYAAYVIESETLVGRWSMPGSPVVLPETLTKTKVRNPALLRGPSQGI